METMWTSSNAQAFCRFIASEADRYPAASLGWLAVHPMTREAAETVAGIVAGVATGRIAHPDRWTVGDLLAVEALAGIEWHRIRPTGGKVAKGDTGASTGARRTVIVNDDDQGDDRAAYRRGGTGSDRNGNAPGSDGWADTVAAVEHRAHEMARSVADRMRKGER